MHCPEAFAILIWLRRTRERNRPTFVPLQSVLVFWCRFAKRLLQWWVRFQARALSQREPAQDVRCELIPVVRYTAAA